MRTVKFSDGKIDTKIKLQKFPDNKEYVHSIYQTDSTISGGAGYLFLSSWYPSDAERRHFLDDVLNKLQTSHPLSADIIENWREEY